MSQICSTNYVCVPVWYTSADQTENSGTDVVVFASGPYAKTVNVICVVKTGEIQVQIKDELDVWFTPADVSFTMDVSGVLPLVRANMPDIRIIATADATFSIQGRLR